jgi:hypothetical protein
MKYIFTFIEYAIRSLLVSIPNNKSKLLSHEVVQEVTAMSIGKQAGAVFHDGDPLCISFSAISKCGWKDSIVGRWINIWRGH